MVFLGGLRLKGVKFIIVLNFWKKILWEVFILDYLLSIVNVTFFLVMIDVILFWCKYLFVLDKEKLFEIIIIEIK